MKRTIKGRLLLFFVIFPFGLFAKIDSTLFPLSPQLETNVRFWVLIFTRYSTSQYLFFDTGNVDRIYKMIDIKEVFPTGEPSPKKKDLFLNAEKDKIVKILKNLTEKDIHNRILNKEELKLASLFGDSAKQEDFRKAAERVRIQHGCLEQFREGLVRSGRYLDSLKNIFNQFGLPEELVYLPHVESSFNPVAGSKAGAIGMWQFINSTGRKFLHIDDTIDERRDPYLSTFAAARLLKLSYDSLQSWPLAITSYNHGLLGIKNIVKELGTKDLGTLIQTYESKQFGFASKNFYAEFLAAFQIAENPNLFFQNTVIEKPWRFKTIELPVDLPCFSIQNAFGLSDSLLAEWNPSLSIAVLKGKQPIPRCFSLRVYEQTDDTVAFEALVSERLLPRGAFLAWCSGMEKVLFRYVEWAPPFPSTRREKRS